MKHVGIDMGLSVTAVVVMDDKGKMLAKVQFGASLNDPLKLARKANPAERYLLYHNRLYGFLKEHVGSDTRVVMEDPKGKLVGNGLKLMHLTGIYLVVLGMLVNPNNVFLPTAKQIKKAFAGSGDANKEQMIAEAKKRGHMPQSDHEADAIGMAYMSIENTV